MNSQDNSLFFLGVSGINSKSWANHENKTVNKVTVVGGGELGIACTLAISAKVCKHSAYKDIYHSATLLGRLCFTHQKNAFILSCGKTLFWLKIYLVS